MCWHPAPPPPQHAGNAEMPPRSMCPLFLKAFTLGVVCGHLHPPIRLDQHVGGQRSSSPA